MTDGERAHLHLMETLPRERIHTHEASPPDTGMAWRKDMRGQWTGKWKIKSTPAIRRWIKENAETHTVLEMRKHLHLSRSAVRHNLRILGLRAKRESSPRKKKIIEWLKLHASEKTQVEISRELKLSLSSLGHFLNEAGVKAKANSIKEQIPTLRAWLRANAANHTMAQASRILNRTPSSIRWNVQRLGLECKPGKRVKR